MKNAYELAETILRSRPGKDIELKSSDSFVSINYMVHQLAKRYRIRRFCVRLYEKVQAADGGTPFKRK